jgi:hypothetical protein
VKQAYRITKANVPIVNFGMTHARRSAKTRAIAVGKTPPSAALKKDNQFPLAVWAASVYNLDIPQRRRKVNTRVSF